MDAQEEVAGYDKKPPPPYPGSIHGDSSRGPPPSFQTTADDPPPALGRSVEFGVFPEYRANSTSVLEFHPFNESTMQRTVIYTGNGEPFCSTKQGFLARDTIKFISPAGNTVAFFKRQAKYPSFWRFAMFDTAGARIGNIDASIQGELDIHVSLDFCDRYDTSAVSNSKLTVKTGANANKPSIATLDGDDTVALYSRVPRRDRRFTVTVEAGADMLLVAAMTVAASSCVPELLLEVSYRINWAKKYGKKPREWDKPHPLSASGFASMAGNGGQRSFIGGGGTFDSGGSGRNMLRGSGAGSRYYGRSYPGVSFMGGGFFGDGGGGGGGFGGDGGGGGGGGGC